VVVPSDLPAVGEGVDVTGGALVVDEPPVLGEPEDDAATG
jgi:hypothetical protein